MTRPAPECDPDTEEFFGGVDTLPELLARRAALTPTAPAFCTQQANGAWASTNWSEFASDVAALAEQFAREGVAPGSRLGILAGTSLGWETAQMAALACGATVAGIDPYYPDVLVNELISGLGLRNLIVENAAALARLSPNVRDGLRFVAYVRGDSLQATEGIPTLALLRSRADHDTAWRSEARPNSPALVAFSSGSAGIPKPILYTHAQVVHACKCILATYPEVGPGTHLVCWLPLANLFQRMINFCATAKGALSYIVEDPRRVMEVVRIANPEVFVAVPRFCERLHAGIMQRVEKSAIGSRIVESAIALSGELRDSGPGDRRISALRRAIGALADRLVLARLRAAMGHRIKFIVSGSAPMPRWLLDRFSAIGIPVLEAYGVSENLVPVAANRLANRRMGTVGKPVGDNEVRIAGDGEVQVRGRGVFDATIAENSTRADALGTDGFLATGDLGVFDDQGFLTLHGRRTEAYKNAQGRWVSLPQVEAALRRLPGIDHAAMVKATGERMIAILALGQEASETQGGVAPNATATDDMLCAALRAALPRELAAVPRAMWPAGLLVVRAGFSPATGELTTNFKLRRSAIDEKFAEPLQALTRELEEPCDGTVAPPPLRFI